MTWVKTAKENIRKKGFYDPDSDYDGMIGKALDELIEVFGKQGHSGYSAILTAHLFHDLVKYGGFFTEKEHDEAIYDELMQEK